MHRRGHDGGRPHKERHDLEQDEPGQPFDGRLDGSGRKHLLVGAKP